MKIDYDGKKGAIRLDCFCAEQFSFEYRKITGEILTRTVIKKEIEKGNIKLNGAIAKPAIKLKENDLVEFEIQKKEEFIIKPKNIPLDILYEDDFLIVLNKQKNLICHPTSKKEEENLVSALLFHTDNLSDIGGQNRLGIVHRLDKNTSGLMLIAKTNESHIKLQKDIQDKKTIRKYLAICYGNFEHNFGTIDKPLVHYLGGTVKMNVSAHGLYSVTHYKVLENFVGASFVELTLETGRTHQIRCHLASINHPLLGDDLYGAKGFKNGVFRNIKSTGQILMSYYLSFTHPISGEIMEFKIGEENYHPDLKNALKILRSIR